MVVVEGEAAAVEAVEEEVVEEEVAEVEVVEEEVAEVDQLLQEEEPMRMQNYWEENPNTSKGIDEMSTDSSRTSSPT